MFSLTLQNLDVNYKYLNEKAEVSELHPHYTGWNFNVKHNLWIINEGGTGIS